MGIPSAGRNHADTRGVIGVFINSLAVRNYPRGNKTFSRFLEEVKENVLRAYENENYPFEEVVGRLNISRDFSRNPVFDVLFASENVDARELEIEGLNFSPYPGFTNTTSHLDLVFFVVEKKDTVKMELEYSSALFKPSSAENIVRRYIEILNQVAANKEIRIKDIEISLKLKDAALNKHQEDYDDFDF